MADFTAITTQEQLDAIIAERLKRDRETRAKKYEGYISPEDFEAKTGELQKLVDRLKNENDGFKTSIAEKDASIKKYETASVKSRIADEIGLNRKLINRIAGETEDEIRKDAQSLKELFGAQQVPPLGSTEPDKSKSNAWAQVSAQLNE